MWVTSHMLMNTQSESAHALCANVLCRINHRKGTNGPSGGHCEGGAFYLQLAAVKMRSQLATVKMESTNLAAAYHSNLIMAEVDAAAAASCALQQQLLVL